MDLWTICARYRWTLAIAIIVGVAVFGAYGILAKPMYLAETVLVRNDNLQGPSLGNGIAALSGLGLVSSMLSQDNGATEAIAVLKSRAFIRDFIIASDLTPLLYPTLWDKGLGSWSKDLAAEDIPSLADAVELFRSELLSLEEDHASQTLLLSIRWSDPELAALWANQLIDQLNHDMQRREIREAESMIRLLTNAVEDTKMIELQQTIYSLLEQQVNRIMVARVNRDFAFTVIDPAVAPEADDYVSPQRFYLLIVGGIGGGLVGLSLALFRNYFRPPIRVGA